MEIVETEDAYRVIFFPAAADGPFKGDEWATRGYRIQLGTMEDSAGKTEFVPKYVDYDKTVFTLDDARFYGKNIKDCAICKSLNAEAGVLERITLRNEEGKEVIEQEDMKAEEIKEYIRQAIKEEKGKGKEKEKGELAAGIFHDVALDFFKSYFTEPGLLILGILLDEPAFIEDLIPEDATEEDMMALRAMIADYLTGDVGLTRSPEELRAYSNSLKSVLGGATREEESAAETGKPRRAIEEKMKGIASAVIFSGF